MEKQLFLNAHGLMYNLAASTFSMIASTMNRTVDGLSSYYSQVLERNVNRQQTWALIEAQAALFLGILPAGYSLLLRTAALIWFFIAVRKCKRVL